MKYVIGIDLGTSAVKTILVDESGTICAEASKSYPLFHERAGWSEQNPDDWVQGTIEALKEMMSEAGVPAENVTGISYSGQMHGLVLVDEQQEVLRRAILWNDTRTTQQCEEMTAALGEQMLSITRNRVLEGFTLPKIRWVQQNEPELFQKAALFLLPKDYVRLKMTGQAHMDYSDAAGTLLLDVAEKKWSEAICEAFEIPLSLCPPLVESTAQTGTLLPEIAEQTGLRAETPVFAGGADNACGAIGAGILTSGKTMCSIGTSGVILAHEEDSTRDFAGKVHFFNHGKENAFYTMGVTLSAGHSLQWFKETFAEKETFEEMLEEVGSIPAGSGGLLYTPYLVGERTPHADSVIRASFIGIDGSHTRSHFARAVMEGITFSLNESIELFRNEGKRVDTVISIGGGAKNDVWLQMQADIFNTEVVKLQNEQGPAMGAAMIAAAGSGMFESLEQCASLFIKEGERFSPDKERAKRYKELFSIYQTVYDQTKSINQQLQSFRV
ncbi:xylulokinase [Domibacillus indicus]|uniref:xylulokinase n=1 Tax=Domibacillus indicus TaxID=1437523 RepID=UPI000617DF72|nr:xylulokinase [Domibacillus indicus]